MEPTITNDNDNTSEHSLKSSTSTLHLSDSDKELSCSDLSRLQLNGVSSSTIVSDAFEIYKPENCKSSLQHSDTETLQEEYDEIICEEPASGQIYPWLVVAGTFLILMVGLGAGTGWGVMQNYFEQSYEFRGTYNLALKLSFVETICNVLLNLLSPLGQIMLAFFTARTVLFVSVILCSAGLILSSFSTQIWHLYVTYGVIYGIGSSIMYYVALCVVPQWFVKNRGLAMGILSSGISVGGLLMPLVMEPLNTNLGAGWCFRILGFVCLVVGIFSSLIFKNKKSQEQSCHNTSQDDADIYVITSNEEKTEKSKIKRRFSFISIKEMFDFSVAKDCKFLLWVGADILLEAGYNVPYYFLPSYATYLGLTSSQGALILSIGSGTNALGRLVSGYLADLIGHVNVMLIYSVISSLSCFFLWTYANTFPSLLAFSIIFGFFGGAFLSLTPTVTLSITGSAKYESGLSVFLVFTVIAMFGPNLAGCIESATHSGKPFDTYKYFTGACYVAGSFIVIILKLTLNRNPFAKI